MKRGLTQSQMAERLGMTEANFSSYERNKSKPPSETLSQIASILGVSADYLLFGSEREITTLNHDRLLKSLFSIVSKFEDQDLFEEDQLIAFGFLGLSKAYENFDETKSAQFETFAARCIENEILMNLRRNKKGGIDDEAVLVQKYQMLDERGKHTVNTVLEMEFNRVKHARLEPVAAHNDDHSDEQLKLMREDLDNLN